MQIANFPDEINGFTFTEYLTIFISILFAFAIADFLVSVGKMIRERDRIQPYWEFNLWVVSLFIYFILVWYTYWMRLIFISDSFLMFVLTSIPPVIVFLMVTTFFPNMEGSNPIDLKAKFESSIHIVLKLLALYLLFTVCLELIRPTAAIRFVLIDSSVFVGLIIVNLLFPGKPVLRSTLVVLQFIHFCMVMITI